jgi:wyosine [tRNA(Phe)-imidazoG37] synthetase (radical SAM superfamily)
VNAPRVRRVYGPVPSKRLGRSLGIDIVPFKTCSYDCVYCQLGRTTNRTVERSEFVPVDAVLEELTRKLAGGDLPDHITISGSGEPTLHAGVGRLIDGIKGLTDIPVAVLTNGSLLWKGDVRDALMAADVVLPSLDAGDEYVFCYVNRPHEELSLERVVDGIAAFTRRFAGQVWLEVFLLAGVTGIPSEARKIAELARHIGPARVHLNTVSRPPAEEFAWPVSAERMDDLQRLFPARVVPIRGIDVSRPPEQVFRDARVEDILALLGRRPCTVLDLATGLRIAVPEALKHLEGLVAAGNVATVVLGERRFFVLKGPARRFEEAV